ncbi:hypothetical protein F511_20704 [Dorcoceras hygrometricum]|uniref:Uncharacterized protein n=1 Tax=Dorcoceras hygrometricum TaxID=472368 RepID=A0A2Z7D6G1_9LAMI|nr:hypothetical protein F511_20704 [Dorcoceras hygrometricum]
MMAEENKSAWADSDSEESSSGTSSSSESKDEVQCLMNDDTEEVFDFSSPEFIYENLVNALNEMVLEYKKFSQSFEEVKAERESCATNDEPIGSTICKLLYHAEATSVKDKIAAQPPIWQGRFCGPGYTAPEKSRESWLNKRVAQMRNKSKSGGIKQGQTSRTSTKDRQYRPPHRKPRSRPDLSNFNEG